MRKLLEQNAVCNDCEELTVDCYARLLEDYFGFERHECNFKHTVQEIADMYADDIVIMRVSGHLTASVGGNSVDVFNCTNEKVDIYWLAGRA